MPELKFCIDCKFYRNSSRDTNPVCLKAPAKHDLVSGQEILLTCENARKSLIPSSLLFEAWDRKIFVNYFCGPEGRYFEEKPHE